MPGPGPTFTICPDSQRRSREGEKLNPQSLQQEVVAPGCLPCKAVPFEKTKSGISGVSQQTPSTGRLMKEVILPAQMGLWDRSFAENKQGGQWRGFQSS